MNSLLKLALLLGIAGAVGCGSGATQRDTAVVDVTANVTGPDGKPLSKSLVIVLQPSGDTLGARLEAKDDGKFAGKAAVGRYVYYVKLAKSDAPPKGIASKFAEPTADNVVDVASGQVIELRLSN